MIIAFSSLTKPRDGQVWRTIQRRGFCVKGVRGLEYPWEAERRPTAVGVR